MSDVLLTHSPDFARESNIAPDDEALQPSVEKNPIKLAKQYVEKKSTDPAKQQQMLERAAAFGKTGIAELNKQLLIEFPILDSEKGAPVPENADALRSQLLELVQPWLEGQGEKLKRAQTYIDQMCGWADTLSQDRAAESNLTVEQALDLKKKYFGMVRETVCAIQFQDTRASRLALGDHGWMHLTQDLRDSRVIATNLKGESLTTKEEFFLGVLTAYHDIGYGDPAVHELQRDSVENYSQDMGHPLTSYLYVMQNHEKFADVLSPEDFEALSLSVLNHENAEQAHLSGAQYEHLSKAFSYADSASVFGLDKLPPVLAQVPEVVGYLSLQSMIDIFRKQQGDSLTSEQNQYLDARLNQARSEIEARIRTQCPGQAEDLINALDHFGPKSLAIVLGRLSAEMAPVKLEGKVAEYRVRAAIGKEFDGYISGAVQAAVKLTVKLFGELVSLRLHENEQLQQHTISDSSLPACFRATVWSGVNIEMMAPRVNRSMR